MKVMIVYNQARALLNFWTPLIRALNEAGYDVVCAVPAGDEQAETELRALGAAVRRYPLERKGLKPWRDAHSMLALYRIFRVEQPDTLFCATIKPVLYGLLAAALAGVRKRYAMITGLGYAFEGDSPGKRVLTRLVCLLYRWSLSQAVTVMFQNSDDLQIFQKLGCLPTRTRAELTIGTGVNTKHFTACPLPQGPPIFLLVARLLEAKGLRDYAEAARLLKARRPGVRFQLLGPPEEGRGGVPMSAIQAWEHEGLVEYLGQTRDIRPYLARATVVVLPSWREGLPCSLMEGMSMGRAVVTTDVPGCRDVVREDLNGILVPVRAPEELALALQRFCDDPALAGRMGEAGREIAETELDATLAVQRILAIMNLSFSSSNAFSGGGGHVGQ